MALTNCKKISDVSITVSKDQNLGSTDAVMFIDPIDSNYIVAAADFQNNTSGLSTYINTSNNSNGFVNGIKLSDTTTPYASDNRIRIDIDLLDTFSPSSNTELTIDIDGSAIHVNDLTFSIAGSYYFQQQGNISITPSAGSYSATGKNNQIKTLFTLTFATSTGYYLNDVPDYEILVGESYSDNYIFTAFDRAYTDGNLTSVKIKVEWQFLKQNLSGHNIVFYPNVVEETAPLFAIDNFEMDTSIIPKNGAVRDITITGTPGASFVFSITNDNNYTYDFESNEFTLPPTNLSDVLDEFGKFEQIDIEFPAVISKEKYQLSLQGGTSPSSVTTKNGLTNNDPFTWQIQAAELISVVIGAAYTNVASLINSVDITNNSLIGELGADYSDETGDTFEEEDLSIVINGTTNLYIRKDVEFSSAYSNESDFTNSIQDSNGGTLFNIRDMNVSGDGTNQITISAKFSVLIVGVTDVFSDLNLDNLINRAPSVSSTQAFNGQQGSSKVITLTGTDPDNDTLAFKITQNVTFGDLYEEDDVTFSTPINAPHSLTDGNKNKVRFKHDNSTNFSPTFKYKANDSFQDSNSECTVTGTIAATNNPPSADPQTVEVNQHGWIAITLVGSDPEGAEVDFKITSIPSNGKLFNALLINSLTSSDPYGIASVPSYYYNSYSSDRLIDQTPRVLGTEGGRHSKNTVVFFYSSGTYSSTSFGFKTSDGKNDSPETTVTINVNTAPTATLTQLTIDEGDSEEITLTATDAESDTVSFEIQRLPIRGTLTDSNGTEIVRVPYSLSGSNVIYKNNSANPSTGVDDTFIYIPIDEHGARGGGQTVSITVNTPPVANYLGSLQRGSDTGALASLGTYNISINASPIYTVGGIQDWFANYSSIGTSAGRLVVGTGGAILGLHLSIPEMEDASALQQGVPDTYWQDGARFSYIDFRLFKTINQRDAFKDAFELGAMGLSNSQNTRQSHRVLSNMTGQVARLSNYSNGSFLYHRHRMPFYITKGSTGFRRMYVEDNSDGISLSIYEQKDEQRAIYGAYPTLAFVKLPAGTYYYGLQLRIQLNLDSAYTSIFNYAPVTVQLRKMHPSQILPYERN